MVVAEVARAKAAAARAAAETATVAAVTAAVEMVKVGAVMASGTTAAVEEGMEAAERAWVEAATATVVKATAVEETAKGVAVPVVVVTAAGAAARAREVEEGGVRVRAAAETAALTAAHERLQSSRADGSQSRRRRGVLPATPRRRPVPQRGTERTRRRHRHRRDRAARLPSAAHCRGRRRCFEHAAGGGCVGGKNLTLFCLPSRRVSPSWLAGGRVGLGHLAAASSTTGRRGRLTDRVVGARAAGAAPFDRPARPRAPAGFCGQAAGRGGRPGGVAVGGWRLEVRPPNSPTNRPLLWPWAPST